MRKMCKKAAAAVALAVLTGGPARAKVVFTGYGDFRMTPQGVFRIDGAPQVLNTFGLGPETLETRSNSISAIGLFATTSINENTRLQMDVTYKNVGATVKTLTIQYGYLEYSAYGGQAQFGKITLPFGYYNQNRFYPFQRPSISAPVFQSAILGLPIADIGGDVSRPFELGDAVVRVDLYSVNGYGPLPGSTTTFRSAGVPSGALTIANNISGSNANHTLAVGGRLDLSHKSLSDSSAGISYYRGSWDPSGSNLFQMAGAHLHARAAGFEFLGELLHLDVKGDQGMQPNFGSRNWRTDGFFAELDYRGLSIKSKPLTPWVRYEDYASRSTSGGGGHEIIRETAAGASVQLVEQVAAKVEFADLYYRLPYVAYDRLLIAGYSVQLGLAVTF